MQTAKDVRRSVLRVFYPYLAAGIAVAAVGIAVSFLTWQEKVADVGFKFVPSPLSWVLIWGGVVIGLGLIVLGAVKGDQWGLVQAREIAKDRTGFPEFYRAYVKRFWPKEGMVTGPELAKFLTFVGKK